MDTVNVHNDPFMTHLSKPQRSASESTRQAAAPKTFVPAASKVKDWLLLGKPIPIYISIAASFAFLWSFAPAVPLFMVLMGMVWTANVGLAHHVFGLQHGAKMREKMAMEVFWMQCLASILAVALGTLTGIYAHEAYMSVFFTIGTGQSYSGVLASSPGAQYFDAGKLIFADTSVVATELAVGFLDKQRYCAAPIMDSGVEQRRTVSFWAIGKDCCSSRGEFECGSAGDALAQGGVRVPPDGLLHREHGEYMRAVRQAAAVFDLAFEEEPVLLRWVEDPSSEQHTALMGGLGVLVLGLGLFALLVVAMSVGLHISSSHLHPDEPQRSPTPA